MAPKFTMESENVLRVSRLSRRLNDRKRKLSKAVIPDHCLFLLNQLQGFVQPDDRSRSSDFGAGCFRLEGRISPFLCSDTNYPNRWRRTVFTPAACGFRARSWARARPDQGAGFGLVYRSGGQHVAGGDAGQQTLIRIDRRSPAGHRENRAGDSRSVRTDLLLTAHFELFHYFYTPFRVLEGRQSSYCGISIIT